MLGMTVDELWKKLKPASAEDDIDILPLWAFMVLAIFFLLYCYIGLKHFIFAGAAFGADNSSHLAEIIKVAARLREGHFDAFWFPQTNLGYALFNGYNILPYLLMGTLVALTQDFWQPMYVYNASIIILHAIVPLCWYGSARLLRLPHLTSLCFALTTVFMSEYTMFGLHAGTTTSMGLYTQLWALPLLPLVFACYYRLIVLITPGSFLATILAHSLLCSVHNLLGFFAGIGGLLLLLFHYRSWHKYLISQAVILVLFSYWLVAWFKTHIYLVKVALIDHPMYSDGFLKTVQYLVEGQFFDAKRTFPMLTLILILGLLTILRTPTKLRAWAVYFFILGFIMLLYAPGDSLLGSVIPFFQEIPYRRYTVIIQFSGALIIAWGASYLLTKIAHIISFALKMPRTTILRDLVIIATIMLSLAHVIIAKKTFRTMVINNDLTATADFLHQQKHARFLVHNNFGTNSHFFRNLLPMLADRSQLTTYARGIRDSLSSYYTTVFDFAPLSYEMFNVRYLVSTKDIPHYMRMGFNLRHQFDKIRVYGADDKYGYFDVVQSSFAVTAFTSTAAVAYLRANSRRFYYHGVLPRLTRAPPTDMPYVAFQDNKPQYYLHAGNEPVAAQVFYDTLLTATHTRTAAIAETVKDYSYGAELELTTSGYLLLKASYHPGWQAEVNGRPTTVLAVAPNFMAVPLPAGKHTVTYTYRNDFLTQIMFLLCATAWLVLLFVFCRQTLKLRKKTSVDFIL